MTYKDNFINNAGLPENLRVRGNGRVIINTSLKSKLKNPREFFIGKLKRKHYNPKHLKEFFLGKSQNLRDSTLSNIFLLYFCHIVYLLKNKHFFRICRKKENINQILAFINRDRIYFKLLKILYNLKNLQNIKYLFFFIEKTKKQKKTAVIFSITHCFAEEKIKKLKKKKKLALVVGYGEKNPTLAYKKIRQVVKNSFGFTFIKKLNTTSFFYEDFLYFGRLFIKLDHEPSKVFYYKKKDHGRRMVVPFYDHTSFIINFQKKPLKLFFFIKKKLKEFFFSMNFITIFVKNKTQNSETIVFGTFWKKKNIKSVYQKKNLIINLKKRISLYRIKTIGNLRLYYLKIITNLNYFLNNRVDKKKLKNITQQKKTNTKKCEKTKTKNKCVGEKKNQKKYLCLGSYFFKLNLNYFFYKRIQINVNDSFLFIEKKLQDSVIFSGKNKKKLFNYNFSLFFVNIKILKYIENLLKIQVQSVVFISQKNKLSKKKKHFIFDKTGLGTKSKYIYSFGNQSSTNLLFRNIQYKFVNFFWFLQGIYSIKLKQLTTIQFIQIMAFSLNYKSFLQLILNYYKELFKLKNFIFQRENTTIAQNSKKIKKTSGKKKTVTLLLNEGPNQQEFGHSWSGLDSCSFFFNKPPYLSSWFFFIDFIFSTLIDLKFIKLFYFLQKNNYQYNQKNSMSLSQTLIPSLKKDIYYTRYKTNLIFGMFSYKKDINFFYAYLSNNNCPIIVKKNNLVSDVVKNKEKQKAKYDSIFIDSKNKDHVRVKFRTVVGIFNFKSINNKIELLENFIQFVEKNTNHKQSYIFFFQKKKQ